MISLQQLDSKKDGACCSVQQVSNGVEAEITFKLRMFALQSKHRRTILYDIVLPHRQCLLRRSFFGLSAIMVAQLSQEITSPRPYSTISRCVLLSLYKRVIEQLVLEYGRW